MKIKNVICTGILISLAMVDAKPVTATDRMVKKMREQFQRFEGYLRCVRRQKKCTKKERTHLISGAMSLIAIMATASVLGQRKQSQKRSLRTLSKEIYENAEQELEDEFMTLLGNGVAATLLDSSTRVFLAPTYLDERATKAAGDFLRARNRLVRIIQEVRGKVAKKQLTPIGAASELSFVKNRSMPAIKEVVERYTIGLLEIGDGTFRITLIANIAI